MTKQSTGGQVPQRERLADGVSGPLVSVGIPVFMAESFVDSVIDQVVHQSYRQLEILISDNASEDATWERIQARASSDTRIRAYRQPRNLGSIANFNFLLAQAAGELFIWLAHDDRWSPNLIEECVRLLVDQPSAACCAATTHVTSAATGRVLHVNHYRGLEAGVGPWRRGIYAARLYPATAVYGLHRTRVLRDSGGMKAEPGGDLAFVPSLMTRGGLIEATDARFTYCFQESWKNQEVEALLTLGTEKARVRSTSLIRSRVRRISKSSRHQGTPGGVSQSAAELAFLLMYVAERAGFRLAQRLPAKWADGVGRWFYWSVLHNPNTEVVDRTWYEDRVVRPKFDN